MRDLFPFVMGVIFSTFAAVCGYAGVWIGVVISGGFAVLWFKAYIED